MSDIFLSYKSEDRSRAKIIAEALERQGYSVWWDRIIPPGKTFDQVIEEALDVAKCVIVLWSKESILSDWVKNEAREGTRRHILVPVLIDDVKIPFEFRHIQAAQLINWQGALPHPEFDLMLKSVGETLGKPPVIIKGDKKSSINELNLSAQQLYEGGKYPQAINAWKDVLKLDPENGDAIEGINKVKLIEAEYPAELQVKSYLQKVIQRLRNEGFDIYENETYNNYFFRYVATKSTFCKGAYCGETFFLFSVFPSIDAYSLRKFSTNCIEYAKKTRRSSRFTTNLFSFPIAIVNSIDRVTSAYIQNEAGAIRSFLQVEMESPVVYDLKSSTLYFVEKRYWIGWRGFVRETVKILLAP